MVAVPLDLPVVPGVPATPTQSGHRPTYGALADRFGRVATDLRVSLTDRCNLRCTYCMPAEGLAWLRRDDLLSDEEISRLVRVAVERLGVTAIRFTGGEPLLRPGLPGIVAAATALRPRPSVGLTTNAVGLARMATALAGAGLDRVNVSLDTLDPAVFATLTRRDRLDDVLAGIAAADAAGLRPVKLNAVLQHGINDHEVLPLTRYALAHGYEMRFIEQMPLDAQHAWNRGTMVTAAEILDRLSAAYALTADPAHRGAAPAETWLVDGGPARVGVIASVSKPFCGACDRTRLTADGQIRNCLFAHGETDLRAMLRGGCSDQELADRWRAAMWGKRAGHGIDDPSFLQPDRPMSAIGG
jgi:cyclic pyranopterin phosphate synthase